MKCGVYTVSEIGVIMMIQFAIEDEPLGDNA